MRTAANTFKKICQEAHTALFCFSGYGGQTALVAVDYDGTMGTVAAASLYLEAMAGVERKVVLLNCCREE
jgi:uncharacterized caspase-like protein